MILELCKGSARGFVDSQMIQSYLDRLPISSATTDVSASKADTLKTNQNPLKIILEWQASSLWQYSDAELKTTESTFTALVQSLLKDPIERAYFFQVRQIPTVSPIRIFLTTLKVNRNVKCLTGGISSGIWATIWCCSACVIVGAAVQTGKNASSSRFKTGMTWSIQLFYLCRK